MSSSLSQEEVNQRLIRLRNLERLHRDQRQRNDHLVRENRSLKERITVLESTVANQQKIIEDFRLQIEELRAMIFGKKKKTD